MYLLLHARAGLRHMILRCVACLCARVSAARLVAGCF
jgi:hypothetical protein